MPNSYMPNRTPNGLKGKEFKRYENHVQRFSARLVKTVDKLHEEDHIDDIALQKINKLVEDL